MNQNIPRVYNWRLHRSHVLRYIQHMCKVLPGFAMPACPLSATCLLGASCGVRWVAVRLQMHSKSSKPECVGERKKRKQKEMAVIASVRLVRGRRPLCCTYTCSTARMVWPAAGTERLPARADRNQQRYQWPGDTNTHTKVHMVSSDKNRTQNFNSNL